MKRLEEKRRVESTQIFSETRDFKSNPSQTRPKKRVELAKFSLIWAENWFNMCFFTLFDSNSTQIDSNSNFDSNSASTWDSG